MEFTFKSLSKNTLDWHPDLEGDVREWLYLDGHTEEGYSYSVVIASRMENAEEIVGPNEANLPLVELRITTPEGITHRAVSTFPLEAFEPKHPWGARIGPNVIEGSLDACNSPSGYQLQVSLDDIGIDVNAKTVVVGMRLVDEEHGYVYNDPSLNLAMGWWPLIPRAEIEGNLTIGGKTIPVKGLGHCERQVTNVPFAGWISHWFWGHLYAGEYTALWADQACTKEMQYKHFRPFVLWKGSDVILSTHNLALCPENFELDEEIGMPYPTSLTLQVGDGCTEASVLLKTARITERNLNVTWEGTSPEKPGCYFRMLADVDLEIKRWDKLELIKGKSFNEFGWITPWFPVPRR